MSIKVTLKMLVPFPTFRNKFWISKPLLFLSILMLQILFTEEQLSKSVWDILLFIIVYLTVNWFVMNYNKPYLETLLPLNFSFFFCLLACWLLVFDFLFSGFLRFFFFNNYRTSGLFLHWIVHKPYQAYSQCRAFPKA